MLPFTHSVIGQAKIRLHTMLALLIVSVAFYSCKGDANKDTATKPEMESGIAIADIDSTVAPGNDFPMFANGTWAKTTGMYPGGKPYNGNMVRLTWGTKDTIGKILKEVAAEPPQPANSPKGQIQAFYASYMDTINRNALGVTPIQDELDAIMALKSKSDMAKLLGNPDYPSIFSSGIYLDSKDTRRYIYYLEQGKMGIGATEYYTASDPASEAMRTGYLTYLETLFTLANLPNPKGKAKTAMRLETEVSKVLWSKTAKRDKNAMYHLMTLDELKAYAPGFDWDAYFMGEGIDELKELVVNTDTAIKGEAEFFNKASLEDLKTLMVMNLLSNSAAYLSDDFTKAADEFHIRVQMGGDPDERTLDEAAQFECDTYLKWQLGEIYADKYLTPEIQNQVETLVGYMKKTMLNRLETNDWMDEPTKKEAIRKFNNIHWKIGRPERIIDQSSLEFSPTDLIGNIQKINRFNKADDKQRLSEPKREWEWMKEAQQVNAYYYAEMNDVVIPIGILQPPCFDPKADAAANFGAVLAVVGHEVGHGFDDQGSGSDADGLLRNWWTDASKAEFDKRTQMIVDQYNKFEPLPGVFVNGNLTLGENIGDIGGLAVAYNAYRTYVDEQQGGKAPVIDGLTGDQRFFLSYAQMWSWKCTDALTRMTVLIDPHSPANYRVIGPTRNMDAWYEAFNVQPGDAMYLPPEERVKIW